MFLRRLVLLAVLAAFAAGCTRQGITELPAPPSLPDTTTSAVPVDLSGVALAAVPGQTTTTIEVGPGAASLTGVVVGPEGPVAGATVRAQRLVGDGTAHIDVLTAADGTWSVPFLKGGRFRVRAWRAPDLSLADAQVFFLEAKESRTINLELRPFTGLRVTSDIAPDPPVIGEFANIVVQVTNESVDSEGVVRAVVVPGITVELFGSGNWRVSTDNPSTTDASGNAAWRVRCDETGPQPLSVVVGDLETFAIGVPDCIPEPTTTVAGESTPESTASSTSTTRPSTTSSSTTTTSRRRDGG